MVKATRELADEVGAGEGCDGLSSSERSPMPSDMGARLGQQAGGAS